MVSKYCVIPLLIFYVSCSHQDSQFSARSIASGYGAEKYFHIQGRFAVWSGDGSPRKALSFWREFRPSSMRTYYTDIVYYEDRSRHPYVSQKSIIINREQDRFLNGKKTYCSQLYKGTFPIKSKISLAENKRDTYENPLSVSVDIAKEDIAPELNSKIRKIEKNFAVLKHGAKEEYDERLRSIGKDFYDLMNKTGLVEYYDLL